VQTAYSVVVAACTRIARGGLRIVHVDAHAAVLVHHLDPAHRAPVVGHALGADDLAAGAALDAADAVRQRVHVARALLALTRGGGRLRAFAARARLRRLRRPGLRARL